MILLVAGFLICPGGAAAKGVSRTVNIGGIDITMSVDRAEILVGEPLVLNITMENTSPAPFIDTTANFQLPEGNSLEVTVQPPGELPYRYSGALELGSYSQMPIKLIQNTPKSVDTLLLYDRTQPTGLLFPKPGEYTLGVKFSFKMQGAPESKTAVLPAFNVHVKPATGAAAEVLKVLDAPGYIRMVHLGVTPTTGSVEIVTEAATKYPGTYLGALSLRAEGNHYTTGENPDYARGAALLQKYLMNGIVPIDADGTVWDIAAAYHYNKQYDLAREWTFYLIRNFPKSIRIRPQDALIYHYFLEPAKFTTGVPWYLLKEPWVVPGVKAPDNLKPRQD